MFHFISRRDLIVRTGKALAGTALLASSVHAQSAAGGGQAFNGAAGQKRKPLFLPPADSSDPAVHSLAENLFWADIIAEHAALIGLLMPGPELAPQRGQADQYRRTFSAQFDRARAAAPNLNNYAAFNRATVELVKPFIEFEQSLLTAQSSGKIHTMIWPSFYEHTIDEGQHAMLRLLKLALGATDQNSADVIGFWSGIMSDHGEFIAHLLDPKEADLVATALDSAAQFKGFKGAESKNIHGIEVMIAAEELIDFETAIETGVGIGTIGSIIPPMLADHVRREALKFVDELKRTGYRT